MGPTFFWDPFEIGFQNFFMAKRAPYSRAAKKMKRMQARNQTSMAVELKPGEREKLWVTRLG
jgi:hypothetical protein